jgi:hypothetical protein
MHPILPPSLLVLVLLDLKISVILPFGRIIQPAQTLIGYIGAN